MTDTDLLKQKIQESGYKTNYLAQELGLSRSGLSMKINNKTEFVSTEIQKLCKLLKITSLSEKEKIFFAHGVDK